jgi:hypothetical protein
LSSFARDLRSCGAAVEVSAALVGPHLTVGKRELLMKMAPWSVRWCCPERDGVVLGDWSGEEFLPAQRKRSCTVKALREARCPASSRFPLWIVDEIVGEEDGAT